MRKFGLTNPHDTAFSPKEWLYQKEASGMESPKMYCPSRCRYRTYHCVEAKYPVSWGGSIGPRMERCETSALPVPMVPRLHQSNGYISKGSYRHGESKNVLPYSVQIPYLPLRARKLPRFMGGIGPRVEICRNSRLHCPMVPRLHQSNGYMKRKLRAWRVHKCIALVGADTVLTSLGAETTPFHGW